MRALRAIPTEEESVALALVDSIEIASESTAQAVPSSSFPSTGDGVQGVGEGGVGINAVDDVMFSSSSSSFSSSSSSSSYFSSQSISSSAMKLVATLPPRRSSSLLPPEVASSRSLINWSEEVAFVLQKDPPIPGGLNFDCIQKRLAVRGHNRKWFEMRAPLKTLLKRGVTRRTLVTLESDGDFLEGIRARWEVEKERLRQEMEVAEQDRIEREQTEIERLREEKEIAEKRGIERESEAEDAEGQAGALVENSQSPLMVGGRSGAEDAQALGGPEGVESSSNSSSASILVLESASYGAILEASDVVISVVDHVNLTSSLGAVPLPTAAAAPSVQQEEPAAKEGASSPPVPPPTTRDTGGEEPGGEVLVAGAKAETVNAALTSAPTVVSNAEGTVASKELVAYQVGQYVACLFIISTFR